jgi:hypothetical protein
VLILGNLFSGFVPNLESIFKASRNKLRDAQHPLRVSYCTKPEAYFGIGGNNGKAGRIG